MKRNISVDRAFVIGFAILTSAAALLRSLAFVTSFDSSVGYFDANIFTTLFHIAIALAAAGAFAYAVVAPRLSRVEICLFPLSHKKNLSVRLGGILVALAFAAYAIYRSISVFSVDGDGDIRTLLSIVFSVIAVPYFLLPPTKSSAWFGLAAPVFCTLSLIIEYFDRYVPMNSPIKLMQQCTALLIVLYFLIELNELAGNPRPGRILPLGCPAVFFAVSNGISNIVAVGIGEAVSLHYLARAVVMLVLGFYIATCLGCAVFRPVQIDVTEEV